MRPHLAGTPHWRHTGWATSSAPFLIRSIRRLVDCSLSVHPSAVQRGRVKLLFCCAAATVADRSLRRAPSCSFNPTRLQRHHRPALHAGCDLPRHAPVAPQPPPTLTLNRAPKDTYTGRVGHEPQRSYTSPLSPARSGPLLPSQFCPSRLLRACRRPRFCRLGCRLRGRVRSGSRHRR